MHERQGPESCNTNNMLKLTEGLFRMHPKVEYADFMNVLCIIISFLLSILNMGDMYISHLLAPRIIVFIRHGKSNVVLCGYRYGESW